jgi:hypothetical protein
MNRRIAVGALLVLLAAGSLSWAVDPPWVKKPADPPPTDQTATDQTPKAPWYTRWFGIGPEPPKPPPPPKRDPAAEAAAQRAAAEADLLRRQDVCDELRQIATETNNPKLAAQADELERRAVELYKRQTAHLPVSRMIPAEDRLDRSLGTGSSAAAEARRRLTDPDKPAVGRTGQANAFREVNP